MAVFVWFLPLRATQNVPLDVLPRFRLPPNKFAGVFYGQIAFDLHHFLLPLFFIRADPNSTMVQLAVEHGFAEIEVFCDVIWGKSQRTGPPVLGRPKTPILGQFHCPFFGPIRVASNAYDHWT